MDSVGCSAPGFSRFLVRNVDPRVSLPIILDRAGAIVITLRLAEGAVPDDFGWTALLFPVDIAPSGAPKARPMTVLHQGPRLRIPDLRAGTYDVTVSAPGRVSCIVKHLAVTESQDVPIEATLVKGSGPESDSGGVLDPMDTQHTIPRLRELLRSLPDEQKGALRGQIQEMIKLLDPQSAERKAYEELLRNP
jgi:hypothetical protein